MAQKAGVPVEFTARRYAQQLLDALNCTPRHPIEATDEHPALSWRDSGLMALTGRADGPALLCPVPLAACADGALAALASLAPSGALRGLRGSRLLAERASLYGFTRQGATSPGGSCRLLECADGWLAMNLARDDDWALLPAWFEAECEPNWDAVSQKLRLRNAVELAERGRELGLALAPACTYPAIPAQAGIHLSGLHAVKKLDSRIRGNDKQNQKPRIIELASLWAGPLCGRLLRLCGAEVIKVESTQRPDGARRGNAEFFERLNAGKQFLTLDFSAEEGREELRQLIRNADIVIEGSRPRALRQLGLHAESLLSENPGLSWISLTGYGRAPVTENWVAYGDDAAVGAGLLQLMLETTGERVIVGDAIADPLTGLHAALTAWAGWLSGGGSLMPLALSDVVAQCMAFEAPACTAGWRLRHQVWSKVI